jgi:hypothetical protein
VCRQQQQSLSCIDCADAMHSNDVILETLHTIASAAASPTSYDVLIIGAGIAGVSVDYWLRHEGFQGSVGIVDARGDVGLGSSGRNAGHVWPQSNDNFEQDAAALLVRTAKHLRCTCDVIGMVDVIVDEEELQQWDPRILCGTAEVWTRELCRKRFHSYAKALLVLVCTNEMGLAYRRSNLCVPSTAPHGTCLLYAAQWLVSPSRVQSVFVMGVYCNRTFILCLLAIPRQCRCCQCCR